MEGACQLLEYLLSLSMVDVMPAPAVLPVHEDKYKVGCLWGGIICLGRAACATGLAAATVGSPTVLPPLGMLTMAVCYSGVHCAAFSYGFMLVRGT
jgi:hypothetical protein